MSEVVCLNCERKQKLWRAGDQPPRCVCGIHPFVGWVTRRKFVKRAIRQMRHGL